MTTISRDGGWWIHEIHAGAAHRDLLDTPTTSEVNVASKCRHWKTIKYYTDWHNVDEDTTTVPVQGGMWDYESGVGITRQDTDRISSQLADFVASMCRHL